MSDSKPLDVVEIAPATATPLEAPSGAALRARGGVREVTALAYPVVLQNVSMTALHVVDMAMVGRVGAVELAAVGYGGLWIWTALVFFLGSATGVQTFVAQAHGAGRPRECGPWVWHALAGVLPTAIVASALFAWTFPALLELLGPAEALRADAIGYVRARSLGAPAVAVAMTLASFFRGLGDMRTPLLVTLLANVSNALLAYGLVFGHFGLPRLEAAGAGLATAASEWLQAIVLGACFARRALRERYATAPCRPRLDALRRFARTGAPIGGMWFLDMIAFSLFSTLIARMGSESMAASQSFVVLLHVSFMQVVGFQIAAMTLVGRYVGAGDLAAAERSWRSALGLGVGYAALVGVLFLSIPELLLGIFSADARVLELGMPLLALGAAFQLLDAVGIISAGALRGAGDTRWPFVAQSGLAWGLFLPLGWVGGVALGGGLTGAWLGATVYVAALGAVMVARFRGGAWRHARI